MEKSCNLLLSFECEPCHHQSSSLSLVINCHQPPTRSTRSLHSFSVCHNVTHWHFTIHLTVSNPPHLAKSVVDMTGRVLARLLTLLLLLALRTFIIWTLTMTLSLWQCHKRCHEYYNYNYDYNYQHVYSPNGSENRQCVTQTDRDRQRVIHFTYS